MYKRKPESPEALMARFLARVTKTETCWIWGGALTWDGYGRVTSGRILTAHRLSHHIFIGPIPEGHQVDHLCHGWDADCEGGTLRMAAETAP